MASYKIDQIVNYRKTSNISRTIVGNKIFGAAPTSS